MRIPKHYIRCSAEEMLQEYLKAVDLLTINEENRLCRQVEELTIKKSEMDEFRAELESLKGILKG